MDEIISSIFSNLNIFIFPTQIHSAPGTRERRDKTFGVPGTGAHQAKIPNSKRRAIAAVVIGGTSLSGGIGTVYGTVGGVLITATLLNIFNLLGVNPYWQRIAIGVIICVAVWSYQEKKKFSLTGIFHQK